MGDGTNKSESIIVFLDITGELLSKKDISKNLEIFMREKRLKNTDSTFTIFYFIEDPNTNNQDPIYSELISDPKQISQILEDKWKLRRKSESYFENGLFYCVSKLAEMVVKKSANYRILVISDSPSKKEAQYADALMNLVETVRNFPTFIDIIRVGHSRFYPDDVKLRIISTITAGNLFYCEDEKELHQILLGLVKNKALPDLIPGGGQIIEKDKKEYYEHLALILVPLMVDETPNCKLCSSSMCNFCNSSDDIPKKCPNCGKHFHECCAALYSWKANIGLKNVFRCPECDVLIKLDEGLVARINGESMEIEHAQLQEKSLQTEASSPTSTPQETWTPPKEESPTESGQNVPNIPKITTMEGKDGVIIKKLGMFGPKIVVKKNAGTTEPEPIEKSINTELSPVNTPPATKESPSNDTISGLRERRKKLQTSVVVCPVCAAYLKSTDKICPKCNTRIS